MSSRWTSPSTLNGMGGGLGNQIPHALQMIAKVPLALFLLLPARVGTKIGDSPFPVNLQIEAQVLKHNRNRNHRIGTNDVVRLIQQFVPRKKARQPLFGLSNHIFGCPKDPKIHGSPFGVTKNGNPKAGAKSPKVNSFWMQVSITSQTTCWFRGRSGNDPAFFHHPCLLLPFFGNPPPKPVHMFELDTCVCVFQENTMFGIRWTHCVCLLRIGSIQPHEPSPYGFPQS